MMQLRKETIFHELPWLKNYVRGNIVHDINVKKIDIKLLGQKSWYSDTGIGGMTYELIKILDNEGNELVEVGYNPKKQWSILDTILQKIWLSTQNYDGENVKEALDRLSGTPKDLSKASFILFNKNDEEFIIYGPETGYTLIEYVEKIKLEEINKIKKDIHTFN